MYYFSADFIGAFLVVAVIYCGIAKVKPTRTIGEIWFKTLFLMLPVFVFFRAYGTSTTATENDLIVQAVVALIIYVPSLVILLIGDSINLTIKRRRMNHE